ncbi:hypothetical protein BJD99_05205 [Rhodococcus sp. 1163]|uniref:hypothetical protein n=1 Tax=unclassified Rhodococcus (in: high G+C Gram-positive bacteria) TaxID=192944 RepID=UPI000A0B5DCF|nr:hypothetical protein [Rhodococcus sp. 1163]ORI14541.1 hypothetical protein BJD99_05205 [Rhodococcus sp. 1163]
MSWTQRSRTAAPAVWSFVLAMIVLGPLWGNGYLLLRDAVSTPRSYFTDSALGTTDAAARAVPQDGAIAALSIVFDGGLVVKTILTLALWFAGWGAAVMVRRLLPTATTPALLTAATLAIWNPYVGERLLQGHWSLLVGYAALPWTVTAAMTLRETGRWQGRAGPGLAVCLAAAGLTPTGAILAAVTALVVVALPSGLRRPRRVLLTGLLALAASSPWLLATAVSGGGTLGTDPAGVGAFAARAEPGLGTLASLAGLGGIWNADAVPATRTTHFAVLGTLLLLAVVAVGLRPLWRRRRNPIITALAVVAVLAVVMPALGATGIGLRVGEWAAQDIPGAGLLRDSQKFLALAMPFYVLAAAAGVMWLGARIRMPWVPAVAAIAALLLALPDLVWGVSGKLTPVDYPPSWNAVAEELQGRDGDVAVLPAGIFRIFPYSGDAPVLDPAPRMLPLDVLQTGELIVAGGSVRGEGSRASAVEKTLLDGGSAAELAQLGVGWVLIERTTPGLLGESADTLDQLERVYADDELALYQVPGAIGTTDVGPVSYWIVVAAHLVWALLLVGGLCWGLLRR